MPFEIPVREILQCSCELKNSHKYKIFKINKERKTPIKEYTTNQLEVVKELIRIEKKKFKINEKEIKYKRQNRNYRSGLFKYSFMIQCKEE